MYLTGPKLLQLQSARGFSPKQVSAILLDTPFPFPNVAEEDRVAGLLAYLCPRPSTAATMPAKNADEIARTIVSGSTLKMGKKVGNAFANPAEIGNVSANPNAPPISAIAIDSPPINPAICLAEKPCVFNTAYSRVRSRAAMTIVLASTSRIIPMITYETTRTEVMIALDIDTKLCWNSFSVSVFVAARELMNISSTAFETREISP